MPVPALCSRVQGERLRPPELSKGIDPAKAQKVRSREVRQRGQEQEQEEREQLWVRACVTKFRQVRN